MDPNSKPDRWSEFTFAIDALGSDVRRGASREDLKQLRKFELWGRACTLLGYSTAWILPNPISAFLISQGSFARWALILHPISHGAFDRIEGVPRRYTSGVFARGWRRLFDWADWMTPANWDVEHNQLHHYHLGTDKDPDLVWRNAERIRTMPLPRFARYGFALLMAAVWKPFYYAPNTVMESRHRRGLSSDARIGWKTWSPLRDEGRELWLGSLLPYVAFRFALLPGFFLIIGPSAALNVLLTSFFAELLTNLHSFATIGPNHTGDDVFTFQTPVRGRTDHYVRQIVGSVNFPAGGDVADFFYGGLNYQIEHHLFPKATLRQCRLIRPKLKEICRNYGIPYNEAPLMRRLGITLQTMAGDRGVRVWQESEAAP